MVNLDFEFKSRTSSSKSVEKMIEDTIKIQEELLEGKKLTGKDGSPMRSWFIDDGREFKPMIGNVGFLVDKSTKKTKVGTINVAKSGAKSKSELLSAFKAKYESGGFKKEVDVIKARLDKT